LALDSNFSFLTFIFYLLLLLWFLLLLLLLCAAENEGGTVTKTIRKLNDLTESVTDGQPGETIHFALIPVGLMLIPDSFNGNQLSWRNGPVFESWLIGCAPARLIIG